MPASARVRERPPSSIVAARRHLHHRLPSSVDVALSPQRVARLHRLHAQIRLTYQCMLVPDDTTGVIPRGLDQDVLVTFLTIAYADVKAHKSVKGALECAVCISEFDDDETLRLLIYAAWRIREH
uniref:Uncharacterized protein n=1 Tax=Oryza brachyantha TaxID=4533 RepID=J3M5Q3_ORYBR